MAAVERPSRDEPQDGTARTSARRRFGNTSRRLAHSSRRPMVRVSSYWDRAEPQTGCVRHATVPTLIARHSPRGIVIGATDFSDSSMPALEAAAAEAASTWCSPLHLLHVVDVGTFALADPAAARTSVRARHSRHFTWTIDDLRTAARNRLREALTQFAIDGEAIAMSGLAGTDYCRSRRFRARRARRRGDARSHRPFAVDARKHCPSSHPVGAMLGARRPADCLTGPSVPSRGCEQAFFGGLRCCARRHDLPHNVHLRRTSFGVRTRRVLSILCRSAMSCQIACRVDQANMGEGLRKVARASSELQDRTVPKVVRHHCAGRAGVRRVPSPRRNGLAAPDCQQARTCRAGTILPRRAIRPHVERVRSGQRSRCGRASLDVVNGSAHSGVGRRQEANQRQHQQARVRLFGPVGLDERIQGWIETLTADILMDLDCGDAATWTHRHAVQTLRHS